MTNETFVPLSPDPSMRWRGLIVIAIVWVVLIGIIRLALSFDNAVLFLATASAHAMMAVVLFCWLTLRAGLPRWLTRAMWALAMVALVTSIATVRVEGWKGDMVPILGPRFAVAWPAGQAWPTIQLARSRDAMLAAARAATEVPGDPHAVDLATVSPHDSPQFLGPARDCVSPTVTVAADWLKPPREVWRQPCGAGWSSFAVVGDFAVTQEQLDDQETTVCYELATGVIRWTHGDPVRLVSALGGDGPRATPTVYAGRVYTFGGTGILNCLDGANGQVIWSRDVVQEVGQKVDGPRFPTWGKSCSPLVENDLVIVSAGGDNGRSLVAYHAADGQPAWSGGSGVSAYASPVVAEIRGRRQIVMLNGQSVAGHDPRTGELLWEWEWKGSEPKVPNPVQIGDDRILALAGYGLGCQLLNITFDGQGHWVAEAAWPATSKRLKPKFTNVVVHNGSVFGIDDGRSLVCLDPMTGEARWRGGRYGHGQILLSGDLLIVQTEPGEVAIVEATPEAHRELTRFAALPSRTWNNPVLAGPYLLVRNDQEAACFEVGRPAAGD